MRVPEIRRHIITTASPERVFDAWTEPDHLARWSCDKVVGWPGYGGTLTMTWEKFNFSMDYTLPTIIPHKKVIMKSLIPGLGMQTLNITLRPYGTGCRVEIVETGPGAEGQEGAGDAKSGWEMSLAMLKTYLENFWGKNRRTFFTIITAPYDDDRLMYYYRQAEGLQTWLTKSGAIGEVGSEVKLRLANGMPLTGQVMAITSHELIVTWKEITGFLELKSFTGSAERKAILIRGSVYDANISQALIDKINQFMEQAIGRLHLIIKSEYEARLKAEEEARARAAQEAQKSGLQTPATIHAPGLPQESAALSKNEEEDDLQAQARAKELAAKALAEEETRLFGLTIDDQDLDLFNPAPLQES